MKVENDADFIVVIEVLFEFANGKKENGTIFVCMPRQKSNGQWHCEFGKVPSLEHMCEAAGADALQALSNALRVLYSTLKNFLENGGKIYKTKDKRGRSVKEEIVLRYYFGAIMDREHPLLDSESQ